MLPIRDLRSLMNVHSDSIKDQFQPWLRGDQMRLTQVLINLVKNSMKFCQKKQGSKIVVFSAFNPHVSLLTVAVIDTGRGIDANEKKKLFHLFGKLESTEDVNIEGSGMGLVLCKRLIQAN